MNLRHDNASRDSASRTRIITVQGPLQLLNVIAVLRYQQEQEGMSGYNDILLIGALSHLDGPRTRMYAACMEIQKAWNFTRVIDLTGIEETFQTGIPVASFRARLLHRTGEEIVKLVERLRRIPRTRKVRSLLTKLRQWLGLALPKWLFADSIEQLRNAVGSNHVKYVYTCRNTQFVNELSLSAFPDARRICYGDGLGLLALNNSYGVPRFNPKVFCQCIVPV